MLGAVLSCSPHAIIPLPLKYSVLNPRMNGIPGNRTEFGRSALCHPLALMYDLQNGGIHSSLTIGYSQLLFVVAFFLHVHCTLETLADRFEIDVRL